MTPMNGSTDAGPGPTRSWRAATWLLWAVATLVTAAFVPVAYYISHHIYHDIGGVDAVGVLTKAAMFLGQRLWLVSGTFAAISAGLIVYLPAAGRLVVGFQALAFVGVCALMAQGMLAPYEPMCAHAEGFAPGSARERAMCSLSWPKGANKCRPSQGKVQVDVRALASDSTELGRVGTDPSRGSSAYWGSLRSAL